MKDKDMPLRKPVPKPKALSVSLEDMEKMLVLAITYGVRYMHYGDFHFELDPNRAEANRAQDQTPKAPPPKVSDDEILMDPYAGLKL